MPTPIDAYLAAVPEPQRSALERLRSVVRSEVPDAEEAIRTRVPALRWADATVVGFGVAKTHCALYVMFGDALREMRDELRAFDVTDRVVRFTPEHPVPDALVRRIVQRRLAEIRAARSRERG